MTQKYHPSLCTGQLNCYNTKGEQVACENSGQDGEYRTGLAWPTPRFNVIEQLIEDRLSGLLWTQKSNFADFPLNWQDSLDFISDMNHQRTLGYNDWRLPNRRELLSLLSFHSSRPALPCGHPFSNVFQGWYWTSTTATISPEHAWYVHTEGGRMFYGGKDQCYLIWPVRGTGKFVLPATGQQQCYNSKGYSIECAGSGQDGEWQTGCSWPQPRFKIHDKIVDDYLTGLRWTTQASLSEKPVSWSEALRLISTLNIGHSGQPWRLPSINELESLVDCSQANPALAGSLFFNDIKDVYWSSTTSVFEPDWAMALYVDKGAIGVGQKYLPHFYVWPVKNMAC